MAGADGLSLKLYVLNDGSVYQEKLSRISETIQKMKGIHCEIDIIDLNVNPEQAEEQQILAIPTLIKEMPAPPLRMIGNIDDIDEIVGMLVKP